MLQILSDGDDRITTGGKNQNEKKLLELPTKPKLWNPRVVCGTKPELQITTDESPFLRKTWLSLYPGDVFWVFFIFLFCFCDSLLANSLHMKQRVFDDRDIFSRFSSRIFIWDWVEKIYFSFEWFSRCFGYGTFFLKSYYILLLDLKIVKFAWSCHRSAKFNHDNAYFRGHFPKILRNVKMHDIRSDSLDLLRRMFESEYPVLSVVIIPPSACLHWSVVSLILC